ncbi:hypothetical protein PENTCL1PPCAC_6348, partial [Pristionchus entomophagus]
DDTPSTSLSELEGKLNERMRIMYSALSSRLDTMEEVVHEVQHASEKGEWLERDDQSRYQRIKDQRKWKEAQAICQSQQASLVTVDSEEENGFVTQIVKIKPHLDFVWLKMKNRPQVTPIDVQFSNITDRDQHTQCTVLSSDSSWSLRSCDQLRPFICKAIESPLRRMGSDEDEDGMDQVSIHPTLKQPIQPWKNNQMSDNPSQEGSNGRSKGDPKLNASSKQALAFLFQ